MNNKLFPIFSVFGIELEYMIVDKDTLDILPIADKLIEKMSGKIQNEFVYKDRREVAGNVSIAISNELALHVIELKTDGPKNDLALLPQSFYQTGQTD